MWLVWLLKKGSVHSISGWFWMLHQQRLRNCGTEPSLHSWIWPNGQGFIYLRFVLLKFSAVAQKLVGLCQRGLMPYIASFLGLCSSLCYSVSMHCLSLFSHSHSVYLGSSEVAQALSESPVAYRTIFLHLYPNACRLLSGRKIFCICTLQSAVYFLSVREIFKSAVADRLIPKKDCNYTHSIGSILGQSPGDWSNGFWICLKWLIYWGDLGRELSDKEERDSGHLNVKPFHYLQIRHQNVAPFEAYPHVLLEEGWKHCQCESDMM